MDELDQGVTFERTEKPPLELILERRILLPVTGEDAIGHGRPPWIVLNGSQRVSDCTGCRRNRGHPLIKCRLARRRRLQTALDGLRPVVVAGVLADEQRGHYWATACAVGWFGRAYESVFGPVALKYIGASSTGLVGGWW